MEENLYPNGGDFYSLSIPEDQKRAQEVEESQVVSELPIIEALIQRLSERIEFYKSIDAIPEDTLDDPEKFMHVVAANKIAAANLTSEKEAIETLVKEYK